MYNQFFSGDTATQTTGTIPEESIGKLRYKYYLDKALGKDVSSLVERIKELEKLENSQKSHLIEPLLELSADVTPEEILQSEQPEDPLQEVKVADQPIMKKHIYNNLPEMSLDAYKRLKNDIQTHGYDEKYPIWLYNGDILDGWNRQKVCDELNITPTYKDFVGTDLQAYRFGRRSNNRRDLTPIQRACWAVDSTIENELLKKEAKERMLSGKSNLSQKIDEGKKSKNENRTDAKLAKEFNTNRTYINIARKLKKENPEMFKKVFDGEETIKKTNIKGIFTGENEWYTPPEYIEKVKRVMGSIDIDPASSDLAQETVQAKKYYTITTNGLDKNWYGNLFMNPPFSAPEINAFIDKFIEEYKSGNIKQGIILTNNSTDTDWFHKLMKIEQLACFTDGRVKFYYKEKKPNITHGQIFFYLGNNEGEFIKEFTEVGLIMRKA